MNCGIYMFLNLATNMYYIGQASNFNMRWKNHILELRGKRHSNSYLQNAWNKYGEENFKFFVLEWTTDLDRREQYWIDRSRCCDRNIGYNLSPNAGRSNLGIKRSEEYKLKMSTLMKGRKLSEETKFKISNSLKGYKHTKEAIINIAKANRKPKSEETKAKKALASKGNKSNTGRVMSKETRRKISIANRGKICSEETKARMAIAQKKRRLLDKNVATPYRLV